MHHTVLNAVTVGTSSTQLSDVVTLADGSHGFTLYYEVSGDGDIDFFYYITVDGINFVKISEAIKRGLTKTSGPGSDGKGVVHVPVIPCEGIKIEAENTDGSNTAVVTAKLLQRKGRFGDFPIYDGPSNATRTIDYAHHEVHDGSAYWAYKTVTLGNGEVSTVGVTTPNTTKWAHLLLKVDLSAAATFDILEDVTSFSGGASFTVLNFNRNSSKTSGLTVITGHTGSDLITPTGGTTIWTEALGTRGASTSRQNASELILNQNSNYLFRVTNGAASNNTSILLTWYEHTNR
jgi:hypothetical protein